MTLEEIATALGVQTTEELARECGFVGDQVSIVEEAVAANTARKAGNVGLRDAERTAGDAARKSVRTESQTLRMTRRKGGDIDAQKADLAAARSANQARKVANRRVRPNLI